MVPFEELQRTFAVRYPASDPLDLGEGTVVVLPSLSFPTAELRKIVGIGYYEERLLFLLMLLRRPGVKVVYLTSMPVEEAVVDYYLGFLPDPAGARSRLHMLAAGDPAPRSLTAKLLDRPELLDRVRELCEGPGGAFVQPFNVTTSEQELSERLGLPLYGPPAALAGLGSKTGSRRVARLAGVPVLDGAEDLRSVEAVEAAARRLGERPVPPVGSVVIKLNDGFSGQGNAVVELGGLNGSLLDSPVVFCAEEESWPSFAAKIEAGGAVVEELLDVPGTVSPSVQLRIVPGGVPVILSTHSQVLGGPNRQVYLGCRFPADPAYRDRIRAAAERVGRVLAARGVIGYFGIDFFVVPSGRPRAGLPVRDQPQGGRHHPPVRDGLAGHRRPLRRRRRAPGGGGPDQVVPGHRQPQVGGPGGARAPGRDRSSGAPRPGLRPPPPRRHHHAPAGGAAGVRQDGRDLHRRHRGGGKGALPRGGRGPHLSPPCLRLAPGC